MARCAACGLENAPAAVSCMRCGSGLSGGWEAVPDGPPREPPTMTPGGPLPAPPAADPSGVGSLPVKQRTPPLVIVGLFALAVVAIIGLGLGAYFVFNADGAQDAETFYEDEPMVIAPLDATWYEFEIDSESDVSYALDGAQADHYNVCFVRADEIEAWYEFGDVTGVCWDSEAQGLSNTGFLDAGRWAFAVECLNEAVPCEGTADVWRA